MINHPETLSFWPVSAGAGLPSSRGVPLRLTLSRLTLATAILVSAAAPAQPEVIRCLPPDLPVTDLPEAVLVEYRAEIGAEFESYFAAISAHIACLDAERDRALAEAHSAADAYAVFLNTPTTQKDRP